MSVRKPMRNGSGTGENVLERLSLVSWGKNFGGMWDYDSDLKECRLCPKGAREAHEKGSYI